VSKDSVDPGLLLKLFVSHAEVVADLGVYERLSRSQHVHGAGLLEIHDLLWDLIMLCPSAEPREASMRSALLELVTIRPEVNTSKFNNMSWASMRTERFVCIFYHLRRLKREEARLVQVAAKLTGQQLTKLKALLRQMELKGPEESGDSQSQGAKSSSQVQHASTSDLQEVAPSSGARVLKRKCSEVSVDSQGFPMMLRSPRQKASPLLQRSVLGEGEARARMRIHGKSPPINEEHSAGSSRLCASRQGCCQGHSKGCIKGCFKGCCQRFSQGSSINNIIR